MKRERDEYDVDGLFDSAELEGRNASEQTQASQTSSASTRPKGSPSPAIPELGADPEKWLTWSGSLVCRRCYPALKASGDVVAHRLVQRGANSWKGVVQIQNRSGRIRHEQQHESKQSDGDDLVVECPPQPPKEHTAPTQRTQTKLCGHATSETVALAFAENRLAFNVAERPYFKELLRHATGMVYTRKSVARQTAALAGRLQQKLFSNLRGKTVALALDAGTILRKSFVNLAVAHLGVVYFFKSVSVADTCAITIERILTEAIATLDAEKIYVSAIVSDNASAMVKAAKALTITLPTDEDEVIR
jgi:hypothetical protein